MFDDIPEATREPLQVNKSAKFPFFLLSSCFFVVLAIAGGSFWLLNRPSNSVSEESTSLTAESGERLVISEEETTILPDTESISESTSDVPQIEEQRIDNVLGHLPYDEAFKSDLVAITGDGRILLHKAAARKFRQMEADARAQGIRLAIISAFRSVDTQNSLFFDVKEQRIQDAAKRAEVSAPPGYSEHHTGYAIDLGDANVPATHLTPKFENTAAFKWLEKNAAKYSFEMSFPPDNTQGISYEPWHWRFVGDRDSLETFYKKKNIK